MVIFLRQVLIAWSGQVLNSENHIMDINLYNWLSDNYIEILGAAAGIVYVFLEIKQLTWLWPVGIITSAGYIWVFFHSKLYADMSLQVYYLVISCIGWYWWIKGKGERMNRKKGGKRKSETSERNLERSADKIAEIKLKDGDENDKLKVTRLNLRTGILLGIVFILLFTLMWFILSGFTDSPVPGWDSFLTSLSIIATLMLARKIYEHWYLWIVADTVYAVLFLTRGLYPTVILYLVYGIMSFEGLREWKKTIRN
jgi:nicotinamide mononucleotide transporter